MRASVSRLSTAGGQSRPQGCGKGYRGAFRRDAERASVTQPPEPPSLPSLLEQISTLTFFQTQQSKQRQTAQSPGPWSPPPPRGPGTTFLCIPPAFPHAQARMITNSPVWRGRGRVSFLQLCKQSRQLSRNDTLIISRLLRVRGRCSAGPVRGLRGHHVSAGLGSPWSPGSSSARWVLRGCRTEVQVFLGVSRGCSQRLEVPVVPSRSPHRPSPSLLLRASRGRALTATAKTGRCEGWWPGRAPPPLPSVGEQRARPRAPTPRRGDHTGRDPLGVTSGCLSSIIPHAVYTLIFFHLHSLVCSPNHTSPPKTKTVTAGRIEHVEALHGPSSRSGGWRVRARRVRDAQVCA